MAARFGTPSDASIGRRYAARSARRWTQRAATHWRGKYASRKLDLADAALVWLAGESGLRRILTVDRADFSAFRIKGGKRFELIGWY